MNDSPNLSDSAQAAQQTTPGSSEALNAASELAANGERLKQEVETFPPGGATCRRGLTGSLVGRRILRHGSACVARIG